MRKKFWIYKITNLVNGKIYIGQTNDLSKRKSAHKLAKDPDTYISRSILKYGWINHKMEVLFHANNVPIELANKIEIHYIKLHKSCYPENKNGMNLNTGGMQGIQTKEQLDRMVESKFYGWKKKIGKENIPIEVYDRNGNLIISHNGTSKELFKILGLQYSTTGATNLSNHLTKGGMRFKKKFIIQWEGENRIEQLKKSIENNIKHLRNAPMTELRLNSLRTPTCWEHQKKPIKNLQMGYYFESISEFANYEGISHSAICKRFRTGKYDGKYSLMSKAS